MRVTVCKLYVVYARRKRELLHARLTILLLVCIVGGLLDGDYSGGRIRLIYLSVCLSVCLSCLYDVESIEAGSGYAVFLVSSLQETSPPAIVIWYACIAAFGPISTRLCAITLSAGCLSLATRKFLRVPVAQPGAVPGTDIYVSRGPFVRILLTDGWDQLSYWRRVVCGN